MRTTKFHSTLSALLLSLGLLAGAAAPGATTAQDIEGVEAAPASKSVLEDGRELTRLFLEGDTAAVHARFNEDLKAAMDAATLAAFRTQVAAGIGEEQELLAEQVVPEPGLRVYLRTSLWTGLPAPVLIKWALDAEERVAAFAVQQAPRAAASPHLQRDTIADLRLPFEGDWYVGWGGRDIAQNYHAAVPAQRFAYDFLRVIDGSTHTGDGTELSQYHCWDRPILAPADGVVVDVVDGLPDQQIGTTNAHQPAGNHVVVDLGSGEFAVLAHFREGSIRVAPGQAVEAGDELGRCGNSGNTSEPHLHFHLQDSPAFGQGHGLPAFFNSYAADGEPVERGEPVKGQQVRATR